MKPKEIWWKPCNGGAFGFIGPSDHYGRLWVCRIVKEYGCYSIVQRITQLSEMKVKGVCFGELKNAKEYFEKTVMKDIFDLFFEDGEK